MDGASRRALKEIGKDISNLLHYNGVTGFYDDDDSLLKIHIPKSHLLNIHRLYELHYRHIEDHPYVELFAKDGDDETYIHQYANTEEHDNSQFYKWKHTLENFKKVVGRGVKCNETLRKAGNSISRHVRCYKYQMSYSTNDIYVRDCELRVKKLEGILNYIDLVMWMRRNIYGDQIETTTDSFNGNKYVDFNYGILTIKATY